MQFIFDITTPDRTVLRDRLHLTPQNRSTSFALIPNVLEIIYIESGECFDPKTAVFLHAVIRFYVKTNSPAHGDEIAKWIHPLLDHPNAMVRINGHGSMSSREFDPIKEFFVEQINLQNAGDS